MAGQNVRWSGWINTPLTSTTTRAPAGAKKKYENNIIFLLEPQELPLGAGQDPQLLNDDINKLYCLLGAWH